MNGTSSLFNSEAGFRAAIDCTLAAATREIRIFDRDLGRMGLDDRDHITLLNNFVSGNRTRHVRIVVHDTTPLEQRLARLVTLMRQHSHAIMVRRTPEHLRQLADSWLLADGTHGAVRFHDDRPRGKCIVAQPQEILPWWKRFDDLWEASESCTPGATTGL
jgi:hypothetical protein